ncbi:uncharacterized protein L3040_004093 [Drepanopeziza brunnea f. sp. 'multigermtubi']|uniref:uncharacterized protein n=1 Tax=Drepanopeziza brunnea f. sp. 'multigermtubi' TaxID=698441 RepID=UPI0023A58824|nr:hypothetical protein L3040_004093 [Drepanopeziza brunnea f. sp. 'multigermtubi']
MTTKASHPSQHDLSQVAQQGEPGSEQPKKRRRRTRRRKAKTTGGEEEEEGEGEMEMEMEEGAAEKVEETVVAVLADSDRSPSSADPELTLPSEEADVPRGLEVEPSGDESAVQKTPTIPPPSSVLELGNLMEDVFSDLQGQIRELKVEIEKLREAASDRENGARQSVPRAETRKPRQRGGLQAMGVRREDLVESGILAWPSDEIVLAGTLNLRKVGHDDLQTAEFAQAPAELPARVQGSQSKRSFPTKYIMYFIGMLLLVAGSATMYGHCATSRFFAGVTPNSLAITTTFTPPPPTSNLQSLYMRISESVFAPPECSMDDIPGPDLDTDLPLFDKATQHKLVQRVRARISEELQHHDRLREALARVSEGVQETWKRPAVKAVAATITVSATAYGIGRATGYVPPFDFRSVQTAASEELEMFMEFSLRIFRDRT